MMQFKCPDCKLLFEAQAEKKEYNSPIYGPCFKYISYCPSCKTESNEYRSPAPQKVASNNGHTCNGCCCHN